VAEKKGKKAARITVIIRAKSLQEEDYLFLFFSSKTFYFYMPNKT